MYSHNRQGQLQVARFLRVVTLSLVMVAAAELTSVLPAQAAPAWLSPVTISARDAAEPQVAFDFQSNAIAVWHRYDGTDQRIEAAFRPAGGSFGAATQISAAGWRGSNPQVSIDPQGNAIAVWRRDNVYGTDQRIEAAFRPTGGSFGAATQISAAGRDVYSPQVSIDPQGNAIAVWTECVARSECYIEAAFRPAGGSFGAATQISTMGRDFSSPQVSIDPQGNAIAVWSRGDGRDQRIEAAFRPAGGSFGAATPISAAGLILSNPQISTDPEGNAIAVWYRYGGANTGIYAAGYDAAGPKLQNLSIPATGVAGAPVAFSVAPLDVWSAVPSTTWSFGDGTNATGTQVTHAYTAPGSYPVSVTSTDAVGNSATATRTISISPAPPGGQVPPPPPGGSPRPDKVSPGLPPSPPAASPLSAPLPPTALGDTTVPIISSFTMAHSRFRVTSEATPKIASRSVRPSRGRGSEFRYTLSESARVKITIERSLEGRKARAGCAKPTRKLRRKARCLRLEGVGALTRNANTGANATPFTGRIGTVALTPGPYRATIVATDKAENTSKPSQLSFTILSD